MSQNAPHLVATSCRGTILPCGPLIARGDVPTAYQNPTTHLAGLQPSDTAPTHEENADPVADCGKP